MTGAYEGHGGVMIYDLLLAIQGQLEHPRASHLSQRGKRTVRSKRTRSNAAMGKRVRS